MAVTAYALVALYRQACAGVKGVANADIQTLRSQLWKVPAEVRQEARRVRVSLPESWEGRALWQQTLQAVGQDTQQVQQVQQVGERPGTPLAT